MHAGHPLYVLILALLLSLGAGCPPPATGPDRPDRVTLTILATNDLHGQLEPQELMTHERPPRRFRVGGAEALAATVASLRASNPSGALLLDAGDSIQGSLVSNTFEGRPVRELLEQLGYAAVAIGNHEFDFGPRGPGPGGSASDRSARGGGDPTGALKAWIAGARFKALAANIIDRSTGRPVDWPNVQPTAVFERAGVRVGVIGVTTPATEVTTMPAHVSGLRFSPMLEAVRRHATRLRASGVGVVVVVAHAGGSCSGRSCSGEIFSDLLDHLRPGEVDVVIAGHTHRGIWRRYRGIPVVEACARGVALARVDLEVDRARNRVVGARVPPPVPVCHDLFQDTGDCEGLVRTGEPRGRLVPSPLLRRYADDARRAGGLVRRFVRRLGPARSRVLTRVARPLEHDGGAASSLGTLFARALLAAVPGADFAVVNSGSLRSDIPAGPVNLARLYSVFPFDNRVATVDLDGPEVRALVSTLLRNGHGILQVANLRLGLECGGGKGRRLESLEDARTGAELSPTRRYRVVISDFLLTGGDGLGEVLDAIPPSRKQIHDALVRDEVARYLESLPQPINTPARPMLPAGIRVSGGDGTGRCPGAGRRTSKLCR